MVERLDLLTNSRHLELQHFINALTGFSVGLSGLTRFCSAGKSLIQRSDYFLPGLMTLIASLELKTLLGLLKYRTVESLTCVAPWCETVPRKTNNLWQLNQ